VERPRFSVGETHDRMEFCVRIVLPNGEEKSINHFANRQDAERWIKNEAETWFQVRLSESNAGRDEARAPAPSSSGRLTRVNFVESQESARLVA
jgi:hypothetical protein